MTIDEAYMEQFEQFKQFQKFQNDMKTKQKSKNHPVKKKKTKGKAPIPTEASEPVTLKQLRKSIQQKQQQQPKETRDSPKA